MAKLIKRITVIKLTKFAIVVVVLLNIFTIQVRFSYCTDIDPSYSELQDFWVNFRNLIVEKKYDCVINVTKFPFVIKGITDDSPVVIIEKQYFVFFLKKLLKEDSGYGKNETMEQLIINTKKIKKIGNNSFRFGEFQFEKINDHWVFVQAYMDTDSVWVNEK